MSIAGRRRVGITLAALILAFEAIAVGAVTGSAAAAKPAPARDASREVAASRLAGWRQALSAHPMSVGARSSRPRASVSTCGSSWRVVRNQNGHWNYLLSDVSALSPSDVWAVGDWQDQKTGTLRNGAQWWDGTSWSQFPVATTGDGNDYLNAVDAIDAQHIFAVGVAHTANNDLEGGWMYFYEGYNGGGSEVSWDPNPTSVTVLNGVADTGLANVMMVGAVVGVNTSGVPVWQTLERQWNNATGTANLVPTPDAGSGDNVLFGITAVSPTDIWAVGYYTAVPGSARRTLIMHSTNGLSWTIVPSPNAIVGDNTLEAIAGSSSTDAWAIGFTGKVSNSGLLFEHWDGTKWAVRAVPNVGAYTNDIASIASTGSGHYEAVGFYGQTATTAYQPLVATYDGASWSTSTASQASASENVLLGVAQPAPGDVWAVGGYVDSSPLTRDLVENYSSVTPPAAVSAVPGDSSATVSWAAPACDGGSAVTAYKVTAYDGCTVQATATVSGAPPATSTAITGLTNGVSYTFAVTAVNAFGAGPQSAPSAPIMPSGATHPQTLSTCASGQYHLTGSDGRTWQPIDQTNLAVSFTPAADSYAVLGGNVDLFTGTAGFNQDVGISVGGALAAWKESGGATAYAPNAAYVQAVVAVKASTLYTATLEWKTNRADPGSIFAGAGPIDGSFSPTRLTVRLIPRSAATVFSMGSTLQYSAVLGGTATSWLDIDSTRLKFNFTTPSTGSWSAYVSGNADMWTTSAGTNPDLGVGISGGAYPAVTGGQPQAWKESGGAFTYSPNAAFVQGVFPVAAASTYTVELMWKQNLQSGPVWAGAGPIGGSFSPTSLAVVLVPAAASSSNESLGQSTQVNSDGQVWELTGYPESLLLQLSPSADGVYELSVSADLFTSVAGYNQDLAIEVFGGSYGPGSPFHGLQGAEGTIVAWKESGGGATYSPNAAFVTAFVDLQGGQQYYVIAMLKTNRLAKVYDAIWAGAGPEPLANIYSPSWLVATQLS